MTIAQDAVPFTARELSRSERIRLDIYAFDSPKLGRRVTVVRPAALALALEQEFDPTKEAYVERPRTLVLESGKVELSLWTRTRKGLEQYLLLTTPTVGNPGAVRAGERKFEAIQAAARQAQIALRLVPEASLLPRAVENANRLRLLAWVQTAAALPQAGEIAGRLDELFAFQPRHALSQLERALPAFDARAVRAVACAQVHAGRLRLEWNQRLQAHVMLERAVGA